MNQTIQTTSMPVHSPTYQQAWDYVLGELRSETSKGDFDTWIRPTQPLGYQDREFQLGFFNSYAKSWVENRLRNRLVQMLSSVYGESVNVQLLMIDGFGALETPSVVVEKQLPPPPAAPPKTTSVQPQPAGEGSPRKMVLQRAYGSERARVIQPERGMFITQYFFFNWLPILGHSTLATILAARSMCYWNPMKNDLRNTVETDMAELAKKASVSVRTVKDVLANELVKKYFMRYKVRRMMTPNGIRTAGIILQVRMDDPLTPEDQDRHHLVEDDHWYSEAFEDETEEED